MFYPLPTYCPLLLRMEELNGPIHRWLSNVQAQLQNHPKGAEIQNQGTEETLSANLTYVQGEGSEIFKEPIHAASDTRILGKCDKTNTSPTLAMMPQIEPSNAYERQPRHKTREDRYEYKPNTSTIGSRSRPIKPKGKRNRARRHTMNDEFHAINVTESRLTLRNFNLGIFSKGKTSSPTTCPSNHPSASHTKDGLNKNHRKDKVKSNLAFSEMMFLSNSTEKKTSGHDSTLTPTRHEPIHTIEHRKHRLPLPFDTEGPCINVPAATIQREGSCSPKPPFQCLQDSAHHPQKVKSLDPNQHCDRTQSKRLSSLPSSPIDIDHLSHEPSTIHPLGDMMQQQACSPLPPKRCRSTSVSPPRKKRKISIQTSSIPYTWSESGKSDAEMDYSLGQRLLTMVHFRLDLQEIAGEHPDLGCPGKYWSLSELWELLKERKTFWSNGVENREQARTVVNSRQQVLSSSIQLDDPALDNGSTQNKATDEYTNLQVTTEVNCEVHSNLSRRHSTTSKRQDLTHEFPIQAKHSCFLAQDLTANNEDSCSQDDIEGNRFLPLPYDFTNHSCSPLDPRTEGTSRNFHDVDFQKFNRDEDDDLFYKTLDAAYDAIFVSNTAAEAASNLQESLRSSQVNDLFECSEPPQAVTIPGCRQALPQMETEVSTHRARAGEGVREEGVDARLRATSQPREVPTCYEHRSHGPNNDMPCLFEHQHRSTTNQNGTRPPADFLGFGRKNKLY